jgi:hypothetical protein
MGFDQTLYSHEPVPRELVVMAAYRDKHGITAQGPLGPTPVDPRQARERDAVLATVRAALRRAPNATNRYAPRPPTGHAASL